MSKFLRCSFLMLAVLALLSPTGCKKEKVYKIGIVNNNPGLEAVIDGFKSGMAKYGYLEGKSITYIYKGVQESQERVDAALTELIDGKADLILAVATPVAQRAKKLTEGNEIPVVFAPVFFADETGLVKSLTKPGGNLTGVQMGGNTGKALEWHKRTFPRSSCIFVPCKVDDIAAELSLSDLKKASEKLGIQVITEGVRNTEELREALNHIPGKCDSIWLLNSNFLVAHVKMFAQASLKNKIPLSSGTSQLKMGVLLSYAQKPYRTGEQASRIAASILKGIPPRELPVETADYFLGFNLLAAKAIGANISDDLLRQADEIIR